MKTYLLLILFCLPLLCYSQASKDSLLKQDYPVIKEKYRLMGYLDSISRRYNTIDIKDKNADKKFYTFYKDSVCKTKKFNPNEISNYLGYGEYLGPTTWESFRKIVHETNLLTLLNFTKKYGYISVYRIKIEDINLMSNINFLFQSSKYDKEFKTLFKQEFKIGNMSEKEYNQLKFILKRKTSWTERDRKWMKKHAGVTLTKKVVTSSH